MIVKTKLLMSLPVLLALSACDNDFEGNKEGNSIGSISISGDTIVGSSLSANLVDTNGYDAAAVTYSWMANDVVISGATSSSYTLVDADAATKITVSASYTDDGYKYDPGTNTWKALSRLKEALGALQLVPHIMVRDTWDLDEILMR